MTPETKASNAKTTAAAGLKQQAKQDEIETERAKGSPLKKGEKRVEERAVAANGDGPVADPANDPTRSKAPSPSKGSKQ
tara:strand:- start:7681 stop:7917 length:237 start_codon:yes stop_codon:yes gene_type:complete